MLCGGVCLSAFPLPCHLLSSIPLQARVYLRPEQARSRTFPCPCRLPGCHRRALLGHPFVACRSACECICKAEFMVSARLSFPCMKRKYFAFGRLGLLQQVPTRLIHTMLPQTVIGKYGTLLSLLHKVEGFLLMSKLAYFFLAGFPTFTTIQSFEPIPTHSKSFVRNLEPCARSNPRCLVRE